MSKYNLNKDIVMIVIVVVEILFMIG